MSVKHKIILTYTKDLSVEIPDVQTYLLARERISKYKIIMDISSKPVKNKMIEVFTKLKYTDVKESKKKALFELLHSTLVEIEDINIEKNEMEKFILCDLQLEIFPRIRDAFIQILRHSGFPEANLSGEVDFLKLYQQRSN
ncbi:MAG: protein-export chaperone SecB [Candidatus Pelagibacter sp.]